MTYEFGRVFCDSLSSITYANFRYDVVLNKTNWASEFASFKSILEANLDDLVENLTK